MAGSPVWAHLDPETPTWGRAGARWEGSPQCSCRGRALVTSRRRLLSPSFSMSHATKSGPGASVSQTVVVGPVWPEGEGWARSGGGGHRQGDPWPRRYGRETLEQGRGRHQGRRDRGIWASGLRRTLPSFGSFRCSQGWGRMLWTLGIKSNLQPGHPTHLRLLS